MRHELALEKFKQPEEFDPKRMQAALVELNSEEQAKRKVTKAVQEAQLSGTAEACARSLAEQIVEFNKSLDQTKEVGLRVVTFGEAIQLHVEHVGPISGSLIAFYGRSDSGNQVQIVQHISQISFLLMAVDRSQPEEPKREMGFHAVYKDLQGAGE